MYASVQANSICVDNRQCWFPKNRTEVVPTRKGICLKPTEYGKVKNTACVIGDFVPELISVVPCPYRSDHMNQLGFLKCPECNPDHCTEWWHLLTFKKTQWKNYLMHFYLICYAFGSWMNDFEVFLLYSVYFRKYMSCLLIIVQSIWFTPFLRVLFRM